ncbi:MAG: ribonuclease [Acetatifactor sp.]|nr:ribonuclease [Acetatifactor sp.]
MKKLGSLGRWLTLWLAMCAVVLYVGCGVTTTGGKEQQEAIDQAMVEAASLAAEQAPSVLQEPEVLDENGSYTTREDVALYLETYEHLPGNFITKKEARALGWEGGSLEPYAPGKCIGGDRFGNYEKLLPEAEGRSYRECDIDTLGADSRGAKRIVYSDDGLIYYTEDHYASFTLLYD